MKSAASMSLYLSRNWPRFSEPISSSPSMTNFTLQGSAPARLAGTTATAATWAMHAALVVGGAAAVEPAARAPWARRPASSHFSGRPGRLHVVVAVEEDGRRARLVQPVAVDVGVHARDLQDLRRSPRPASRSASAMASAERRTSSGGKPVGGDAGDARQLDQRPLEVVEVARRGRRGPASPRHRSEPCHLLAAPARWAHTASASLQRGAGAASPGRPRTPADTPRGSGGDHPPAATMRYSREAHRLFLNTEPATTAFEAMVISEAWSVVQEQSRRSVPARGRGCDASARSTRSSPMRVLTFLLAAGTAALSAVPALAQVTGRLVMDGRPVAGIQVDAVSVRAAVHAGPPRARRHRGPDRAGHHHHRRGRLVDAAGPGGESGALPGAGRLLGRGAPPVSRRAHRRRRHRPRRADRAAGEPAARARGPARRPACRRRRGHAGAGGYRGAAGAAPGARRRRRLVPLRRRRSHRQPPHRLAARSGSGRTVAFCPRAPSPARWCCSRAARSRAW